MTAVAFVTAARGFVARKASWRHQGRKPWAVDCIGMVELSAIAAAYVFKTELPRNNYGREPWEDRLRHGLRAEFGAPVHDWQFGDIPLIRWGNGDPSHVGIFADYLYGGLSIIHADKPGQNKYSPVGGVKETGLRGHIRACVIEVYRPTWGEA